MNQILVTEKIYVTPELKRKKKFYKTSFIMSIFIIIALTSVYVYATYDRTKNEEISQEILSNIKTQAESIASSSEEIEQDKVWKIIISTIEETPEVSQETQETQENQETDTTNILHTSFNGKDYDTVGSIKIPKINVYYPILAKTSVELLKIAPCKFYGPEPNEVGNLCIAGHNYRNDKFFSKALDLVFGDIIMITDASGRTLNYSVYDKYEVVPEDTSCTSQNTNGKKIVTLITCTNDNKKRVIIQAKEIE